MLVFRRGPHETARVEGDRDRLDLLEEIVGKRLQLDLGSFLLPNDVVAFEGRIEERENAVSGLLEEGRQLVEEVERVVCALYDVPDELTEEIVAHAVRRAGGSEYSSEDVSKDPDGG